MDLKKCPYCGEKLEEGTLRGRGGNFFLPLDGKAPLTYSRKAMEKQGAVLLPPSNYSLYPKRPTAFVCRGCKMILLPFE